ncbi:hypothetical protein EIK76_02065 [Rheinheimera mesophila]|uniref:Uncharacterized protein n=1 Tax=Rheinheimera mesophila TaxID=1547515 RepID=A0A3P3QNT0_9GAMM|nr:hypothetical protein [Rheinheimera mesophila]KKL02874.1 hypothetical protein SD53_03305 [Rheinheimera mesophila]RRJ22892.1 hypothetical protein EIK76_02065 [Rheinheimera mesophila]
MAQPGGERCQRIHRLLSATGFAPQFSDDSANCILLSDHLYLMLLTKARFASFSPNPLVNSHAHGFEDLDGDVWELLSMEMPQASV